MRILNIIASFRFRFTRRNLTYGVLYLVYAGLVGALKSSFPSSASVGRSSPPARPVEIRCPTNNVDCSNLPADCLECDLPTNCTYGQGVKSHCYPKPNVSCQGSRNVSLNAECKYCWQTDNHVCQPVFNCSSWSSPTNQLVRTTCWANEHVICLGNRTFYKKVRCNWTSGYKWPTALILSVTLGGFGADRFYLGLWRSGLGKLFSFGGVGVWTLIDVILIGTGYIGPADGSVYMPYS